MTRNEAPEGAPLTVANQSTAPSCILQASWFDEAGTFWAGTKGFTAADDARLWRARVLAGLELPPGAVGVDVCVVPPNSVRRAA